MNPIFFMMCYCHLMDKDQATGMNPIFLRCVLSSDGQGPGDRDELHFFFRRCILSTDGQAPGDGDEPHYLEEDCHMRDEYQKMVIDSNFFS